MSRHEMAFAGSFYPKTCEALQREIAHFSLPESPFAFEPKAIIVPHAGYVYSGECANSVYAHLDASRYTRAVVIGPTHRFYFDGISVSLNTSYATPCQELVMDTAYAQTLLEEFTQINSMKQVHREHSTETQFPLLAKYLPNIEVVELIYGNILYYEMIDIMKKIMSDEKTLLVVSTDLSHFHPLDEAKAIDEQCVQAINHLDIKQLTSHCEACGKVGILALLSVAKQAKVIGYQNSYAYSGDDSSVVGYLSAIVR